MKKVTYEQYLKHVGLETYVYMHSHTLNAHITNLFTSDGKHVAQIYRGEETEYYING
ncbi:hypothetical protein [Acinetobacter phage HFM1]|nr:hypothetical protein [Acinetobacter phage HFM1]